MKARQLLTRAASPRARQLPRPARAAVWLAGAAAWTAVVLREGKALERVEGAAAGQPSPEAAAAARKSWLEVFKTAAGDWSEDQISRFGASLAYFTMFSIAPLVLIMIAVIGLFFGKQAADSLVTGQMQGFLGPDKAKALHAMVVGAQQPGAGSAAGIVGFVSLLFGASSVVGELQSTLNEIYGVRPVAKSLMVTIRRRFVSLGFVLGMGFLLLVSLALNTAASAAGKYFGGAFGMPEAVMHIVNQGLSFGVITMLFVGMFRYLPDARIGWRDLWVGGALTALLFTLGNLGLGLYLGKAGPSSAYGAAGSLLAFLVWTYYCAQIVYFGAEITQAYAEGRGGGIRTVTKAA